MWILKSRKKPRAMKRIYWKKLEFPLEATLTRSRHHPLQFLRTLFAAIQKRVVIQPAYDLSVDAAKRRNNNNNKSRKGMDAKKRFRYFYSTQ